MPERIEIKYQGHYVRLKRKYGTRYDHIDICPCCTWTTQYALPEMEEEAARVEVRGRFDIEYYVVGKRHRYTKTVPQTLSILNAPGTGQHPKRLK